MPQLPARTIVGVRSEPETHEVREVPSGGEFEVVLSAPGASGYRWELVSLAEGTRLVDESPAHTSAAPTPGSPRTQRFVLKAAAASGRIVFQLRRPWEPAPVRSHAVEIRVRPRPQGRKDSSAPLAKPPPPTD